MATLEDITYRQTIGSANNVGDIPAGTVSGDVLVAYIAANDAATFTTPGGWTLLQSEYPGFSPSAALYKKVSDGTEGSTLTIVSTLSTNRHYVAIGRITGASDTDTSSDTTADFSGTSHTSNGVTATGTNQLVIGFVAQTQVGASWNPTAPSGMTLDQAYAPSTTLGVAAASYTASSAGATGTKQWTTLTTGEFRSSAIVTFLNTAGAQAFTGIEVIRTIAGVTH